MREPVDTAREIRGAAHDLLYWRAIARDHIGRTMIAMRACPRPGNTVGVDAQSRTIDRSGTSKRPQHNRSFEGVSPRIRHIAEPERLAVFLRQPAKLQSDERHELGVLADLLVDDLKQSTAVQLVDVIA